MAGLTPAVRAAVRLRLVAASAAGLAVVVALAALLAPVVAAQVDERPVDPRRYVEPPRVESLDENPLIRISGWALNPDQRLLDVRTVDGASAGGPPRIRLAVLSDYDGVTWRVGATYRNAGRILPATDPAPGATTEAVTQEITVADLTGRLLPAVPTPREVTGARVAYDPASGTLIRPEGLAPGLRYEVSSVRERPDANLLSTANVPAGDEVARVLRVPDGAPEPLRRLATQLAESNGAPYARADAIATFLAEHYRVTADAPSGHAYPNLAFFLFGPRNGGGQRGTSEQFAAAFAVLGRLAGLPTRVVVGFGPDGDGPVRAADAYAWPEVLFDGVGWVPFDPMPRPDEEPRPVEEDFRPQPEDPPPSEVPAPTEEPSATPPAAAPAPGREQGGPGTPVLVGGGVGGLALLVGAVLAALVRDAPPVDPLPSGRRRPGRTGRGRVAGADRRAAPGRAPGRAGPGGGGGRRAGPPDARRGPHGAARRGRGDRRPGRGSGGRAGRSAQPGGLRAGQRHAGTGGAGRRAERRLRRRAALGPATVATVAVDGPSGAATVATLINSRNRIAEPVPPRVLLTIC